MALLTPILMAASLNAQSMDPATCPMHAQHVAANSNSHHGHDVDGRHDSLGMSHDATHHNFLLFADGGAIELRANDVADRRSVEAIRAHLHEIAAQFTKNDFKTPTFVHGTRPDGVDRMQRLHKAVRFRYENVDGGGRVRITTSNSDALSAVHDFLHFQIVEHHTGDSGQLEADRRASGPGR